MWRQFVWPAPLKPDNDSMDQQPVQKHCEQTVVGCVEVSVVYPRDILRDGQVRGVLYCCIIQARVSPGVFDCLAACRWSVGEFPHSWPVLKCSEERRDDVITFSPFSRPFLCSIPSLAVGTWVCNFIFYFPVSHQNSHLAEYCIVCWPSPMHYMCILYIDNPVSYMQEHLLILISFTT